MRSCTTCKKSLSETIGALNWFKQIGHNKTDALTLAFQETGIGDRQCCRLTILTGLDVEELIKDKYDKKNEPKESAQILSYNNQYPKLSTGFLIEDANPILPNEIQYVKNFQITDINWLPDNILRKYNWKGNVLALWSGNKKIIPIVYSGNQVLPASIKIARWGEMNKQYTQSITKPVTRSTSIFLQSIISDVVISKSYNRQRTALNIQMEYPNKIVFKSKR